MGLIQQYVKDNQLEEDIFIADEPQGIAITLSDRFLFDVGKAELKPGRSGSGQISQPVRRFKHHGEHRGAYGQCADRPLLQLQGQLGALWCRAMSVAVLPR